MLQQQPRETLTMLEYKLKFVLSCEVANVQELYGLMYGVRRIICAVAPDWLRSQATLS